MKVIAVVGAARRGKTTSIKKSAEEFADMPEFSTYLSNIVNDEDIQSVIENKNGMRIAFCSAGDYWEDVDKNIEVIEGSKMPDVARGNLILASHSGNSDIAYFKHLDMLTYNDVVYIYYI